MEAGMPAGKSLLDPWRKRFDPLRARIEIFLSGQPHSDPLYLTNRTWQQKLKIASLIAVAALLLITLVTIGATDPFRFHKVGAYEHPVAEPAPPAAVPQQRTPDPVLAAEGLEVVNIRIARDARPPVVTGIVRNNSNREVASAEVSYYLADTQGSLVGTDTTGVANLAAHGSVSFRMPLKIAKAEYVIVRDVHPN
jgi:hypothetical protein